MSNCLGKCEIGEKQLIIDCLLCISVLRVVFGRKIMFLNGCYCNLLYNNIICVKNDFFLYEICRKEKF